jgi:hypothetical protein
MSSWVLRHTIIKSKLKAGFGQEVSMLLAQACGVRLGLDHHVGELEQGSASTLKVQVWSTASTFHWRRDSLAVPKVLG